MWIMRNDTSQLFGDDIARSEITPRACSRTGGACCERGGRAGARGSVGVSGEALATMTSPDAKGQKLAANTNTKFVALDKVTPLQGHHELQQLLRVRHRQGRPGAKRAARCGHVRGR